MKRGSALLMALWVILVLGVIVMSFAFEARLQGGVNGYVQGKNRVKRLLEAGRTIGEVVLLNYSDVSDWTEGEDEKELFEDDRWYKEKRDLKNDTKCTIGPILLDEKDPDSGTVRIDIALAHDSDGGGGLNINKLFSEDANYIVRWQMILDLCGVPREDDFRTEDGKSINLQYRVIGCWNDYRDEDTSRTSIDGIECGAEEEDYVEYYDDHKDAFDDEDRLVPPNGEIADLKELSRVLCFREYPAILTGGVLNPWENKKDQIVIPRGLMNLSLFSTSGGSKVNVNDCNETELLTVPGVYNEDEIDEDDKEESLEVARAIVACRTIMPKDYDVDETRTSWPYKDWQDLRTRVEDEFDVEIGEDASAYFVYKPEETTVFQMTITARSMGMDFSAVCECYVNKSDKKVRYVSWKEN